MEFTQDTVADRFNKYMENTNAVPSDVTLDKKNCKASIGSKGTNVSEESTKFSINLSITYNGKSTTQQNIPWKQDANNVVFTAFVSGLKDILVLNIILKFNLIVHLILLIKKLM